LANFPGALFLIAKEIMVTFVSPVSDSYLINQVSLAPVGSALNPDFIRPVDEVQNSIDPKKVNPVVVSMEDVLDKRASPLLPDVLIMSFWPTILDFFAVLTVTTLDAKETSFHQRIPLTSDISINLHVTSENDDALLNFCPA
jgi:hypothetical protein